MNPNEYGEEVRELVRTVERRDLCAPVDIGALYRAIEVGLIDGLFTPALGLTDKGRELLRAMVAADEAPIEFEAELYGTGSYEERGEMVRTINLATMDMSLPTETRRYRVALTPIGREPDAPEQVYPDRYPMCADQPAQIDCRRSRCRFHNSAGECTNPAPAITLNGPPSMTNEKGVCWSYQEREPEPAPDRPFYWDPAWIDEYRESVGVGPLHGSPTPEPPSWTCAYCDRENHGDRLTRAGCQAGRPTRIARVRENTYKGVALSKLSEAERKEAAEYMVSEMRTGPRLFGL